MQSPFIYLAILIFVLSACTNTQALKDKNYEQIANLRTCDQIETDIIEMESSIERAAPSETGELVKDTAISAATTGVNVSGVLGSAGVFAGLGVNFGRRLYDINARERRAKKAMEAQMYLDTLYDAYTYKNCGDLNDVNPAMDWTE